MVEEPQDQGGVEQAPLESIGEIGHPEYRLVSVEEIPDGPQLPNKEMIRSIEKYGVTQTVVLFERPDGGYEVAGGSRLHMAAVEAGVRTIPALVYGTDDWPYFAAVRLSLNANRSPNPIAELDAIMALLANGMSEYDITAATGLAQGTIAKRLLLASLHDELRVGLQTNKIPLNVAEAAARCNAEQQEHLVAIYREKGKLTTKDIKEVLGVEDTPKAEQVSFLANKEKHWRESISDAVQNARNDGVSLLEMIAYLQSEYTVEVGVE